MMLITALVATIGCVLAADGVSVWIKDSMSLVMPATRPPGLLAAPVANISLARGEYESFQIVIRSERSELRNVRLVASDMIGPGGSKIPAGDVEWLQVGYVKLDLAWWTSATLCMDHPNEPGWWPDPLLPVSRFNVSPGFSQSVWINVYAKPGLAHGMYKGNITLASDGIQPVSVPVNALVRSFDIPKGAGNFKTAFAMIYDQSRRVLSQDIMDKHRIPYGEFALKHRLNPTDIYSPETPRVPDLEHYYELGMNSYCAANPTVQAGLTSDKPEEFKAKMRLFMLELEKSRYAKQLKRMVYIYGYDEASKASEWDAMQKLYGEVRKEFGLTTFTMAFLPQDPAAMAKRNVSWICPLTGLDPQPDNQYDLEQAERCRAAGYQVWAYVCCFPDYPYANFNLSRNATIESRVLWWQAYHQKMDGVLYYALNLWSRAGNNGPIDPEKDGPLLKWNVTSGEPGKSWANLHGDGMLIYPGVNGPIGSIRLANIRDGLEDYEYLYKYAQLCGSNEKARNACEPVTKTLETFTRKPSVLQGQRDKLAVEIENLSAVRHR